MLTNRKEEKRLGFWMLLMVGFISMAALCNTNNASAAVARLDELPNSLPIDYDI